MRLIGLDYGSKTTGIAYSEGKLAQGLTQVSSHELTDRLQAFCATLDPDVIIIGLPIGRLANQVKKIGFELEKKLKRQIIFWDETLTSVQAQSSLRLAGVGPKRRQNKEHQTAAAVLLQSYIEAKRL